MGVKKRAIWEMVGAYPVCSQCQSRSIARDASATWSMAAQNWQLTTVFDHFVCESCDAKGPPEWMVDESFRRQRIQRLNDQLRHGQADRASIVITSGVKLEGDGFVRHALGAMMAFDAFTKDNDPHGEHDFGAFEVNGQKLFFKIDYFDLELERHSIDAADPACTHRVLTIMLASEY